MPLLRQIKLKFVVETLFFSIIPIYCFYIAIPGLEKKESWPIISFFTVITIIGSFASVKTLKSRITLNSSVFLSALILFGLWVAIWAAALDLLLMTFVYHMNIRKLLPNLTQIFLTFIVVNFSIDIFDKLNLPWMITDIFVIIVYLLANTLSVSLLISYFYQMSFRKTMGNILRDYYFTYLMLLILGSLGTRLYQAYGPLVFVILSAAFIIISGVFHQYYKVLIELDKKMKEIVVLNKSFISSMANVIDAKDPYTHGHSHRVAYWAQKLAIELGLSEDVIKNVYYGGILHDIGKVGVPDSILLKEGTLTNDEYKKIQEHPTIGYYIVEQAGVFQDIFPAVRSHHERVDGKGYPDRLTKDEIPLVARILAICDSFDAMVSQRPYRKSLTTEEALDEIRKGAGTQFDEELVPVFVGLVRREYAEAELSSNRYQDDAILI